MKRQNAREIAFKIIYSKFFNAMEELDEELLQGLDANQLAFVSSILKNFASHYEEINNIITEHLKGYTISRVNKVDLAIIVLALIEIKYIQDSPKQAVINEAIELAKKYSTEKSYKFINGLLADILK